VSAFAVEAVLSGFEAENVAVGLVAGGSGTAPVALGSIFGGATFLVCVALGLGALLFPLEVRLPRPVLLVLAATAVLAGFGLISSATPRWVDVVLLAAFVALVYLVWAERGQEMLRSHEVDEAQEERHSLGVALGLAARAWPWPWSRRSRRLSPPAACWYDLDAGRDKSAPVSRWSLPKRAGKSAKGTVVVTMILTCSCNADRRLNRRLCEGGFSQQPG
jgi:Ca2+/Na+ antiporter